MYNDKCIVTHKTERMVILISKEMNWERFDLWVISNFYINTAVI